MSMWPEQHERVRRGLGALATIREILGKYKFAPGNEEAIKHQVVDVLGRWAHTKHIRVLGTEVIVDGGRYDVLVECDHDNVKMRVVLELKVRGTVGAVETQAQRYALQDAVDAVGVVTTSSKLARELAVDSPHAFVKQTLGSKAFSVIFLRTSL